MPTYLKFSLRSIFAPSNRAAVHLLRLMAGFNDSLTMYECYFALSRSGDEIEILINDAKRWYFFRMACAHLYEALIAFQDLIREDVKKIIVRMALGGHEAYEQLRTETQDSQGFFHKVLKPIRSKAAFHYNYKFKYSPGFQESLCDFDREAEGRIIIAEKVKGSRFLIADDVMNNLVMLALGRESAQKLSIEEMGAYAKKIGHIQGALLRFVDHFFKAYLEYYDLVANLKISEAPPQTV